MSNNILKTPIHAFYPADFAIVSFVTIVTLEKKGQITKFFMANTALNTSIVKLIVFRMTKIISILRWRLG